MSSMPSDHAARMGWSRGARPILVLITAVFAVAVAQIQMGLNIGQSAKDFAADSDATLRVVGWAFAIWGVIYLGLLVYAVRLILPRHRPSAVTTAFSWPSILAFLGIGAWIVAAALDAETMTIVLIFGSLGVLLFSLLANADRVRALSLNDPDRWFAVWPLALLAGWLGIAAPVNLITVATGNGDLPTMLSPNFWAIGALGLVAAGAVFVTSRLRTLAFALPVIWGLTGVFAAEQARNPTLAWTAAILAGLLALAALWLTDARPEGCLPG